MKLYSLVALLTTYFLCVEAVKKELFKDCEQSGFCHRNRHYAKRIAETKNSYYSIDAESLVLGDSGVSGDIHKRLNASHVVKLPFSIDLLDIDGVRIRIDEDRSAIEWDNKLLQKERYSEAWRYAFVSEPELRSRDKYQFKQLEDDAFSFAFGDYELEVSSKEFKIVVTHQGEEQLVLNDRSLFNVEHYRNKHAAEYELLPEESNFNSYQDSFKDSKDDSLPFGPESIALDVTFKRFKHVYGIPEHADTLSLKDTTDSQPYRLYNVDIFEYETDSRLPMYGAIPLMISHKPELSVGFFWINAADTWVDVKKDQDGTKTHWISENGVIDFVILLAKTPSKITENYSKLTGTPQLPSLFSLGYHQCRWNYIDEEDVLTVSANMDKYEIPYDVIWLDVEYADSKKYFTWNTKLFPNPVEMMNKLDESGRTLVTIIDPHLKSDYPVSQELSKQHLALLTKDGEDFHGHCWPGDSLWIDTFNPKSRAYWNSLFENGTEFAGDAGNLHIWNDMNEPSVFSGPETSTPKDVITYGGVEIRSNHNAYGLTYHEATFDALKARYGDNKRPFVLTRSYFAGSQRSAAMWTGDNMSKWEYLKISIPMILTQNIVGMPFSGADVGGFFGNPSKELLTRWYQAGIWNPFFRAHAHIDSRRREPWIPGEPYTSIIREAVKVRYQLLPLFYTKFFESSVSGAPVVDPLFYRYPKDEATYEIEDEFFIGDLLIKPVTVEDAKTQTVYLPDDETYYDYETFNALQGKGNHEVDAPLEKIPVFIRGGAVISRKDRYRRSSKLMKYDPYTLVVALGQDKTASGKLYIDDGETFEYTKGEFLLVEFELKGGVLSGVPASGNLKSALKIEKILVIGADVSNATAHQDGKTHDVSVEKHDGYALIKNPGISVGQEWSITFPNL